VIKIEPKKIMAMVLSLLTLFCGSALAVTTNIPTSASVSKYISVTFSYSSLDFGTVASPSTDNEPTNLNQDNGELNVTTDTNANYEVSISGTDFSGPETIAITNMEAKCTANVTEIVEKVSPLTLSTSPQTCYTKTVTSAGVQATEYNGYWLDIPANKLGGSYSSTITLIHQND
jgi:hypothetical protein